MALEKKFEVSSGRDSCTVANKPIITDSRRAAVLISEHSSSRQNQ
jgi:hypothetical protein